jgi:hypothetical protein
MEGNESNHLRYRKEICDFMRRNRMDYEPFIDALYDELNEDNKNKKKSKETLNNINDKFEAYIKNLEQSSTYGGNDCLVAFSRLYNLEINIHQLEQPIWKINSTNRPIDNLKQIHLSYHNGDHYSSIRRLGDETHTPTNISIDAILNTQQNAKKLDENNRKSYNYASNYDYNDDDNDNNEAIEDNDINDRIEKIMNITNCYDLNLIKQTLNENNNNLEASITSLMSKMMLKETNDNEDNIDNTTSSSNKQTKSKKLSAREKKYEKKQRQMERQRQKIIEEKEKNTIENQDSHEQPQQRVQQSLNNEQLSIINVSATNI